MLTGAEKEGHRDQVWMPSPEGGPRGAAARAKTSTMIMRPPQQGQTRAPKNGAQKDAPEPQHHAPSPVQESKAPHANSTGWRNDCHRDRRDYSDARPEEGPTYRGMGIGS
jgi:hypothetical protein